MGNKEVIDYVMNSPGNTNKAVLKGLLGDTGGGSGGGIFTVEIGTREGSDGKEITATWQEIYDAVKSGMMINVLSREISMMPGGNENYIMYFITEIRSDGIGNYPYNVGVLTVDNMGTIAVVRYACSTPDERPYKRNLS